MTKAKTILLRGFFYLMALQILNLSIDFDYIAFETAQHNLTNYDDIDSFTEYIVESLVDNDNFTSEDDDDCGAAQEKGAEKSFNNFVYFEQPKKIQLVSLIDNQSGWTAGLDQANKTCKGYFSIIAPPPKA